MSKSKKNRRSTKTANIDRRIFAIDIENYCNNPRLTEADVAQARKDIEERFTLTGNDQVLIGTTHTNNRLSAKYAWPGARVVFKPNKDGADLAMIAAIDEYGLDSFSELVLLSGDGIFTEKMVEASKTTKVAVASRKRSLSRRLAAAVSTVILL